MHPEMASGTVLQMGAARSELQCHTQTVMIRSNARTSDHGGNRDSRCDVAAADVGGGKDCSVSMRRG